MKNCPNCNIQYEDSVNFCNNCGTELVAEETEAAAVAEYKPNFLFVFLYKVLAIVSAMFAACSIASPYYSVSVNYNKYLGTFSAYEIFRFGTGAAVFALLLALGTLAFAVLTFIQGLIKKGGKEALFDGIVRLAIGTALLIVSIVILVHA